MAQGAFSLRDANSGKTRGEGSNSKPLLSASSNYNPTVSRALSSHLPNGWCLFWASLHPTVFCNIQELGR